MADITVDYIDHMGDDLAVVNAARVSFAKESEWEYEEFDEYFLEKLKKSDEGLINYLAKHNHWTPFAHTAIKVRVGAPVPIRTQCFKHKQGFVENEESRRYISSRPELYIPKYFRSKPEGSIKQGSGDVHQHSVYWRDAYTDHCNESIELYEEMIAEGIAPEQARFILPQGVIVNWIWTGNLYSFANFVNKRTDPNAQKEVKEVADRISAIVGPLFPVSWKALIK